MSDMSLEEFRSTRKRVENVSEAVEEWPETPGPGWVYLDCLVIEEDPLKKEEGYLIIGNCEYTGGLLELEQRLYNWAISEGYGT